MYVRYQLSNRHLAGACVVAAVLTASKATEGQLLHPNGLFPLKTLLSDYEMQVWISKLAGVTGSSSGATNDNTHKPLIHTLAIVVVPVPAPPPPTLDSSRLRPTPPGPDPNYNSHDARGAPPKTHVICIGRGTVNRHAEAPFEARSLWTLSHRSGRDEVTELLGHRLIWAASGRVTSAAPSPPFSLGVAPASDVVGVMAAARPGR